MNKLIYFASPYSSGGVLSPDEYYQRTIALAAYYIKQGFSVWSPIIQTYEIAKKYDMPKDAGFWEEYNKAFISRCSAVWVVCFPGWHRSVGVKQEVELARILNIPVSFVYLGQDNCSWVRDTKPPV